MARATSRVQRRTSAKPSPSKRLKGVRPSKSSPARRKARAIQTPARKSRDTSARVHESRARKSLSPTVIARLFDKLAIAIPEPKSELKYASVFELLVSVILSAQATDKGVNLATQKLFPKANTPAAVLALGETGLLSYIRTIGLAPTKAKNIIGTCLMLLERHGGEIPNTREALEALPGVGRKTANVVLNTAFGEPTLAVDTHVFRVANRTGLAPGKTPLEVEQGLLKIVPPEYLMRAHHLLILHGRYTCVARSPQCPTCPIRAECAWPEKTA
jgi:endonuclease III